MIFNLFKKTPPAPTSARVLVAISGGVDSAVTLALLKKQGLDCIAVHMNLWRERPTDGSECMAVKDLIAARQTAASLDVPFYVLNFEKKFKEIVVDDFLEKYAHNLTPNPCVTCNRAVKFGLLLQKMKELGCTQLATGHYTQIKKSGNHFELLVGVDPDKDQSYFLYHLTPEKLKYILFPLGHLLKTEVKQLASDLGLKNLVERPESRGICFYRDKDVRPFLQRHLPQKDLQSGDILDPQGHKIGEHLGLPLYTIGQRIGLPGLPEPYYVWHKDLTNNSLLASPDTQNRPSSLQVKDPSWIAGTPPAFPLSCLVRIRYRGPLIPAHITSEGDTLQVTFEQAPRAITSGQAAVFYEKSDSELRVLGGGEIA